MNKKEISLLNKIIYPKTPSTIPRINAVLPLKDTMPFLWCDRRTYRLSILVCIHRKCRHLREKHGLFSCKYKRRVTKLLEKRISNHP